MVALAITLVILASLFALIVGIVVFYGDPRNRHRRGFVMLAGLVSLWALGNLVFAMTSGALQFGVALMCYAAAMLLSMQLFAFCVGFVAKDISREKLLLYLSPGIAMAAASPIPGVIASGVNEQGIVTNAGWLAVYGVVLLMYLLGACLVLLIGRRRLRAQARHAANIILLGMSVSAAAGATCNLVLPLFGIYSFVQFGPASSVLFIGAVGYTIVRHGLFDVRTAVVRSVAYVLAIGTLAGVYFGFAYLLTQVLLQGTALTGANVNTVNIILALLLAFVFQPIKQFFDRVTDRIFFRNRYDSDELIERLGTILTSTTELKVLLQKAAEELRTTLKVSYVAFTVHRDNKSDVVVGAGRFVQLTTEERRLVEVSVATLDDGVLVVDDARIAEDNPGVDGAFLRLLHRRHAALLVPLSGHVGYLLLGEALGGSYTLRDVKLLNAISDELVIAIQNARSVQEVRELNMHLQQRIDHATQELRESNSKLVRLDETKDEFISMASHQLRTPLTSIKGYLSMVLEGDMGHITPAQQKVLSEAYSSSERMVRLIGDFLNVSRLQTGKFIIDPQPTNLAKLIAQEVEAMQQLAESHDMMIAYTQPAKFPILEVDADKLRQVIMNFIDNAIYYSRPKSTIAVKAYVEHGYALVEVHDQGIGVPKSEQDKLFTKFFRAGNARRQRPDGTGVGLFLARKIVTALGGEIIFSSQEGKGSVFGFRLPIKKLAVKSNTPSR